MKILFSPAGDTDPVRGFYDGGILHTLRHYGPMDKVIVFLTKDMEIKEKETACYTTGIRSVDSSCEIEFIESGITDPHQFGPLTKLQDAYTNIRKKYPEAEWYFNLSSGTPQIKTVMALIALDYSDVKAIQVASPEKKSNRGNKPWQTKEDLEQMLELNEDNEPSSPNRCSISNLVLLKKHSLTMQIKSLVQNYEYEGALQILRSDKELFSEITEKLLHHAVLRKKLMWKKANKVISEYEGQPLIRQAGDFEEFFRNMELYQRKKQLSEFILKISPLLYRLGRKYLDTLIDINQCGYNGENTFYIDREKMLKNYGSIVRFIEDKLKSDLRKRLTFHIMVVIFWYFNENEKKNDEKHKKITDILTKLRTVEKEVRNSIAHEITNIDEDKIKERTGGLTSADIMKLFRKASQLIRGQSIQWDYDNLNEKIINSL